MLRKQNGFTLVELMVVIVIIGILAALAIPKFMDASTKAKFSEVPTVLSSYDNAQVAYVSERGSVGAIGDLVLTLPASKWFTYTSSKAGECYANDSIPLAGLKLNDKIAHTTVSDSGTITHTVDGGNTIKKYIPNFSN